MNFFFLLSCSECAKHCTLCYNETECYECTQGFYLNEDGECEREYFTFELSDIKVVNRPCINHMF